jgi:hypothetical protein
VEVFIPLVNGKIVSTADSQVNSAVELFAYQKRKVFIEPELHKVKLQTKKPAALSSRLRKHRLGHFFHLSSLPCCKSNPQKKNWLRKSGRQETKENIFSN